MDVLNQLLEAGILWALIPLSALSIPIIAIIHANVSARQKLKISSMEKAESRRLYERIAMEKLDIIKTAISMGYKTDELTELDRRLEMLVGADRMTELLDETGSSGRSKSKGSKSDSSPVKVKVSMSSIPEMRPMHPMPQRPTPASSAGSFDTSDEMLLRSDDLMDRATLEALSKELESRQKTKG